MNFQFEIISSEFLWKTWKKWQLQRIESVFRYDSIRWTDCYKATEYIPLTMWMIQNRQSRAELLCVVQKFMYFTTERTNKMNKKIFVDLWHSSIRNDTPETVFLARNGIECEPGLFRLFVRSICKRWLKKMWFQSQKSNNMRFNRFLVYELPFCSVSVCKEVFDRKKWECSKEQSVHYWFSNLLISCVLFI